MQRKNRQVWRNVWRKERRLWNEVQMDTIYARQYDDHWGADINDTHRAMLARLLDACPPGARILDAACGTGKYWPLLLERGFTVQGTDQSRQMLARAHEKYPDVPAVQIGLQELAFSDAFDAAICMDAMENVFPEDWPLVLGSLRRALHPGGPLYFTVEVESEEELRIAFEAGMRLGLPLVQGEYAHHGGYHFYPTDAQVRDWLGESGLTLTDMTEGDGYRHYLTHAEPGERR
ncbi:MAG TPA: class I SAM-dependent methyltransferase [Ktedonobacterales bacterium]|jgi:ubiquinone/menaquinone biosynthesis C-methylase UbiE